MPKHEPEVVQLNRYRKDAGRKNKANGHRPPEPPKRPPSRPGEPFFGDRPNAKPIFAGAMMLLIALVAIQFL